VTVGHRLPPYTPLLTATIPAAEELLPFTVDVDPDLSDDQAGLAFHILAGQGSGTSEVCLDDVAISGP
jgi:hypothetical protein